MSESNAAPAQEPAVHAGPGVVSRREFLPPANVHFADLVPEEQLLIDWQRDAFMEASGVTLVELRDVRVWSEFQSICVHDEVNGMHADLSLVDEGFAVDDIPADVPVERLEGTTALLTHLDPHNFYHWLIDTVPCFGVLELAGIDRASIDRFYLHHLNAGFQRSTLARLGVGEAQVCCPAGQRRHYEFERLLVPLFRTDRGAWPNPWAASYLKSLYLEADRRAANDPHVDGRSRRCVYVRRGETRRAVTNEAALEERLAALGFTVLAPETHSPEEQARALARADCVLGAHGAGLANAVFCPPGAQLLEFGGHYITTHFRVVAQMANLRHRAIAAGVGEDGERLPITYDGDIRNLDFECDVDAVVDAARDWFGL